LGEHTITIGGKGSPLRLVGRVSHYHWWEGLSLAIWLARHLIAIDGNGTPSPFDGKLISVAFQKDTGGLSSGYSNDIIRML